MKIGHYQLQCAPGDFAANRARVLQGLEVAEREGIAILSFPESFLTGFFSARLDAWNNSFTIESTEIQELLATTKRFNSTWIVGFNERRGELLYNSVLVAQGSELLGIYSKAFPEPYFEPGREFPIFHRDGVPFGVVICADGGYIEPARILALQGARIIFAPHYNYIAKEHLIDHFQKVRADHIARAVENGVWFLRGNSVTHGQDKGLDYEGVGYGDSYLLDPQGEIVIRSQRGTECLIATEIDLTQKAPAPDRSRLSATALYTHLLAALHKNPEQSRSNGNFSAENFLT